jgi:hypothetical protein
MKKGISLLSIISLLCIVSWRPDSGLASDKRARVEVTVKTTGEVDQSNSALWVRNLSLYPARVDISNASSAHKSAYASAPIASGATMKFAEQLPATLRHNDDLVVQSDEQVAIILADQDFPADRSEFFQPGQQEISENGAAPRWLSNLEIVGRSGSNLLKADTSGYAPVVKGRDQLNRRYEFSVALSLRKRNSSVQVRLINSNDEVIKSAILCSSTALYWRSELGEYISGNGDFPVRFEINVLSGKAQGFFSIKDLESGENTPVPIVQRAPKVNGIRPAAGGAYGGGIGFFSNGVLDCAGSSYTYHVVDAPPNVCGTLYITRNGVLEITGGWICTDNNGNATKGPWVVSKNQTGEKIHIRWPDGTRTSGGDDKIDDLNSPTPPSINLAGVPSSFSGTATDIKWGAGFGGATNVLGHFMDMETELYWDGFSYASASPVHFGGFFSITGRWSASWGFGVRRIPPPSAHTPGNQYRWCATIDDQCNQRSGAGCYIFRY